MGEETTSLEYETQITVNKNDLDKAIKIYCDAISVDPLNFLTYAKTGLALWEKDYLEESVVAFHKSIELNPDFEIAQNNLGVVYLDGMGDPKESVQYFKNAININIIFLIFLTFFIFFNMYFLHLLIQKFSSIFSI